MTKAAGFYNSIIQTDEPAFITEPLNAYRVKEKMPSNLGEYCYELGKIEILKEGINALKWIGDFVNEEKIDCDFKRSGHFFGAHSYAHFKKLEKQI